MSGPIINPIWFYLISALSTLKIVASICCGVSIFCIMVWLATKDDEDWLLSLDKKKPDYLEQWINKNTILETVNAIILRVKWVKRFIAAGVISLILVIFTPSRNDMYLITAANLVTYENIDAASTTAKDAFDYIIDSIKEITDKEE